MDTEELIQALQEVIDTTRAHDTALDKFEGGSWDYLIKDKENAQKKV